MQVVSERWARVQEERQVRAYSLVWHTSSTSVTWLIHMRDMTHAGGEWALGASAGEWRVFWSDLLARYTGNGGDVTPKCVTWLLYAWHVSCFGRIWLLDTQVIRVMAGALTCKCVTWRLCWSDMVARYSDNGCEIHPSCVKSRLNVWHDDLCGQMWLLDTHIMPATLILNVWNHSCMCDVPPVCVWREIFCGRNCLLGTRRRGLGYWLQNAWHDS